MRDYGGMISFLAESEEEATAFVASTKIFKLAESLGGVRIVTDSSCDLPVARAIRSLSRRSLNAKLGAGGAGNIARSILCGV